MRTALQVQAFRRRFTDEMALMRRDGRWPEVQDSWTMGFMCQFFCGMGVTGLVIAGPKAMLRGGVWIAVGFMLCIVAGFLTTLAVRAFSHLRSHRRRYAWYKGLWPTFMTTYDAVCLFLGLAVGCLALLM